MVPNQPLVLNSDGKPRSEDDLLAYGWVKFMDTGDPLWIPRLPMVKSAVRAMDTVTALLASEQGGKADVKTFVVAGGSKRGWTTWLTGAVDKRVVAIVPIVIDVVNVQACSINHFCCVRVLGAGDRRLHPPQGPGPQGDAGARRPHADRGPVLLPRPADHAEVRGERRRRPVLPAGLVEVLLRRPGRAEVPPLRAQRRPLPPRVGRARQHPGLLPGGPDQDGDAEVLVGDGRGRLDPRQDGGQADAR